VIHILCRCKHYFCEKCAIKQYAISQKCFQCNTPSGGQFNIAKDFIAKLSDKKSRLEKDRRDMENQLMNEVIYHNENDGNEDHNYSNE
jgi:RING finger protein 113A